MLNFTKGEFVNKQTTTAAIGLAINSAIAFSSPSTADDFGTGPTAAGWYADSLTHNYCMNMSYVPSWSDPMNHAMTTLNTQTKMTTSYVSLCTSNTDAQFVVSTSSVMGSNTLGSYQCTSKVKCECMQFGHFEVERGPTHNCNSAN